MSLFALPLNQQFYEALMSGDITRMEDALEEGGDVDGIDIYSRPLLCVLLHKRNEIGVKFILDHGANVNIVELAHSLNPVSITPLHLAAASGRPNLVKLLLEHNVNVNVAMAGDYSWTPLLYAIINDTPHTKLEIVKLLLKHGADLSAKLKKDGSMAIHHAAEHGAIDVIKFLLKQKLSDRTSDSKSRSNNSNSSSSYPPITININVQDNLKRTPIDYAYSGKQKEMAVFLLSKGALLPNYGRTKARSIPFVIQALIEGDATLNTYRRVYQQLEDKIRNSSKSDEQLINLSKKLYKIIEQKEQGILIPMLRQRKIEEIKEEDKDKTHISELPNVILHDILSRAKLLDSEKEMKQIKKITRQTNN